MASIRVGATVLVVSILIGACTTDDDRGSSPPELPARLNEFFASPPDPDSTKPADGWLESGCSLPLEHLRRIRRGVYAGRSHDVIFVPREPNYMGSFDYSTHGGPWDYLQRVPLVLYGPGHIKARGEVELGRETTVADIAPTLAELLDFDLRGDRSGRALGSALVPRAERTGPPKAIVVVVWDGGGTDVLEAYPDSWPHLESLIERGTAIDEAIVGSAPSVTPPVHATIGTGSFPVDHGIVDLNQRHGDSITDSYVKKDRGFDPRNLELTTLADEYDLAVGNAARVAMLGYRGWHVGMMGHGSALPRADKDAAPVIYRNGGELFTNSRYYSLPSYLRDVEGLDEDTRAADRADGEVDSRWFRIPLDDPLEVQYTPAWTRYQTRLTLALLDREGFGRDGVTDLFFVNYKQIDDVGHFYGMISREMEETVATTDAELARLTDFLDETIGAGEWVMALTADHGETPYAAFTGAWPIDVFALERRVAQSFDVDPDELFLNERTMGFWMDEDVRRAHSITLEEVADRVLNYRLRDSLEGRDLPERYESRTEEPLFSAAFPSDRIDDVWKCAIDKN